MALPEIKQVEMQYLNTWFSNLVDNINYDLGQIETAVPALSMVLTNIDTTPIQYLKESLDNLVDNLNAAFTEIDEKLRALEAQGK